MRVGPYRRRSRRRPPRRVRSPGPRSASRRAPRGRRRVLRREGSASLRRRSRLGVLAEGGAGCPIPSVEVHPENAAGTAGAPSPGDAGARGTGRTAGRTGRTAGDGAETGRAGGGATGVRTPVRRTPRPARADADRVTPPVARSRSRGSVRLPGSGRTVWTSSPAPTGVGDHGPDLLDQLTGVCGPPCSRRVRRATKSRSGGTPDGISEGAATRRRRAAPPRGRSPVPAAASGR